MINIGCKKPVFWAVLIMVGLTCAGCLPVKFSTFDFTTQSNQVTSEGVKHIYSWIYSDWKACTAGCGDGTQTRPTFCQDETGNQVDDTLCTDPKLQVTKPCHDFSSCGSLSCQATFTPAAIVVDDVTTTSSSTLTVTSATAHGGTYSCDNNGPSGLFNGTQAAILLSFAYPSTCTINVNRQDGKNATCTASISVGCDKTSVQNLYNSSVTTHNPIQDEIAKACVDASYSYYGNTAFGPSASYSYTSTRFSTTCASRWCANQFLENGAPDNSAIGLTVSPIQYNPGQNLITTTAAIAVECRHNALQTLRAPINVCRSEIQNNPPQEEVIYTFSSSNHCTACGCDVSTIKSHWIEGPDSLISCGTQTCVGIPGKNFKWGILAEVNDSIYIVKCSRAVAH